MQYNLFFLTACKTIKLIYFVYVFNINFKFIYIIINFIVIVMREKIIHRKLRKLFLSKKIILNQFPNNNIYHK